MHQKGLAPVVIILILAGVIALAGGGYYLGTRQAETFQERLDRQNPVIPPSQQPQPTDKPSPSTAPINTDETANWQVYTNVKYNFSVKFPNSWVISDKDNIASFLPPGADQFPATQKDTPGEGQPPPSVTIVVINKSLNESDSDLRSSLKQLNLNVNGVDGIYYNVLRVPIFGINFDLPTKDNKKTIRFSFPKTLENFVTFNPKNIPSVAKFDETTFKNIISTFKFTN